MKIFNRPTLEDIAISQEMMVNPMDQKSTKVAIGLGSFSVGSFLSMPLIDSFYEIPEDLQSSVLVAGGIAGIAACALIIHNIKRAVNNVNHYKNIDNRGSL